MLMDENNTTLDSKVFRQLEDDILNGKYKEGDAVTEQRISNELGVSRTPVREAFHRLEKEGLIKLVPNKGAIVIGVSVDDLVDIYKIRIRLEGLATRMAAENITESDRERLIETVELTDFYISKNDTEKIKNLDSNFHDIIYSASGSRMIYRTLSDLHRSIKRYRKISLTVPNRLPKSIEEHKKILEAILATDAKAADKLASSHVERALVNVMIALGKQV